MTPNIEDKQIIQSIRGGTEQGFRLLMKKFKQPVYWHIRRMVVAHDDAQDATQETFISIYRNINQLKDTKSLRGWIFRIATNEALDMIASRRQEKVSLDQATTLADKLTTGNYVDYTDLEAVKLQKAILALPTKQQLAFNMRYYDEMGYDEIGEALGSSPSSAKTNYHLAKEKIIKYMNANN